jgi:hypothetical protein
MKKISPDFSDLPRRKIFSLFDKNHLRPFPKNATGFHINRKAAQPSIDPHDHLAFRGFHQELIRFDYCYSSFWNSPGPAHLGFACPRSASQPLSKGLGAPEDATLRRSEQHNCRRDRKPALIDVGLALI